MWVKVKKGDSVQSIASGRGHPEEARKIADANDIRSVRSKFSGRGKKQIRVPRELRASESFHVLAGDTPPRITNGYAKFETVDRPMRAGLTMFTGYDPIEMEVPIRFEATTFSDAGEREGSGIEDDIALLERMAGRGQGSVSGVGPPPVVRVSTTRGRDTVPLIPSNYQYSEQNPSAPLWRVAGVEWDDGAWRNDHGNRIRQLAVVTLRQHVRVNLVTHSATQRARQRGSAEGAAVGRAIGGLL